jgi:hypothetical protein
MELIGLYLVACYLLVVAGAAKAVRPEATVLALTALPVNRLPLRWVRPLVRTGAGAELALGLMALAAPGPVTAWLVAASYAGFAVVVAYARSTGGALASCGCFGTPDTPATALHLAVDVGLCGAAAAVALAHPAGSMPALLAQQPAHGIPLVALSGLCAWLVYLAVSALAAVQAARALTSISFRRRP